MKPAFRDLAIGATALVGVIGLAVILLLFGELSGFGQKTYDIQYRLDSASGLLRGSRVKLNGVPVGQISSMTPILFPEPGVDIVCAINEGIRIPRDAKVSITVGLLNEGSLTLRSLPPTDPNTPPPLLNPGEKVVARASTIFEEISSLLDEKLSEMNRAAGRVAELSETYTRVGAQLEEMLEPRSPQDVDAGLAPANISTVVARVDRAVAGADRWLGDEDLRLEAKDAVARIQTLMTEASDTMTSFRAASDEVRSQASSMGARFDQAVTDFARTATSISGALEDVRVITGRLMEGEGTAGQLLVNPDLYRSLRDAAVRLDRALTEAQLLLEKWKAEGVPIQF